jgi:hypothetical protein
MSVFFFFSIVVVEKADDHLELSVHSHDERAQFTDTRQGLEELRWRLVSPPHTAILPSVVRSGKTVARD